MPYPYGPGFWKPGRRWYPGFGGFRGGMPAGAGPGPWFGRGPCGWWWANAWGFNPYGPYPGDEASMLKDRAEELKAELDEIQRRLDEIEKGEKD